MNDNTKACVTFENTHKKFGSLVALDCLNLQIPRGSVYGFLGPNGAGKTTAMRILVGISKPTSGSVQVLDSNNIDDVRHLIGYLPEEKGLYKRMRVIDYIVYFGRLNGLAKKEAVKRANQLLNEFQLEEWAKEKCQSLSKGMGQKVQLMATLINDPQLMVLDEPFSGLDPVNVEVVRTIILEKVKQNSTVILSTHIMEQAETLCDAVVLINKGKAVLEGPLNEVRKGDTISVDHEGDVSVFDGLPGVISVKQVGHSAVLSIEPGHDTQAILQTIFSRTKVSQFNANSVSLHEIFLREVKQTEVEDATD
ncbi:MAG: ATP-binding cassette domain-containing protein [Gammaproteobacteria bacterium]|nr:ATP-binding cassette domain-containing protein [Gammaproteobacteria bacterium]MYF52771.1 ATP-binding cassette domain-containing protein [Gammaproteobacteria bacterium]MYK43112.1 ATP-binding cassette domain-containing protein [Gammaproteobacteria bacterium]